MAKIIVFEHQDYKGNALTITGSQQGLGGFNNEISSLIVVDGAWMLYQHEDMKGDDYPALADGGSQKDGCYPSYNDWSGPNNDIGSIKLLI